MYHTQTDNYGYNLQRSYLYLSLSILGLLLLAISGYGQQTSAEGFIRDSVTKEGIVGVKIDAVMQDTTVELGFQVTTDTSGFWQAHDIPVKELTTDLDYPYAESEKLIIFYMGDGIKFTLYSDRDPGLMKIVDLTGRVIEYIRFERLGQGMFEGVWMSEGDIPGGVMLLSNGKFYAKFYTGLFSRGNRQQEARLQASDHQVTKTASSEYTKYLVQARHPDYQPKDTLVNFQRIRPTNYVAFQDLRRSIDPGFVGAGLPVCWLDDPG